ncbi:hypothetical protein NB693_26050 [Pantoea ananatis]|uniref:hypothetical protein n=1 Tax=Pantoea ananas TaxID=553 RepID=UPI002220B6E7|nr:hypothetical protein [Pantoea ananatis]
MHLAVVLALALTAGPAFAGEGISKVNGSITADAGKQYGDLETVNGSITVQSGAQVGSVETVNGRRSPTARSDTARCSRTWR